MSPLDAVTAGRGPAPGPMPGPAPAARRIGSQARFELRTVLANGEQLLLTVVIPVVVLVLLALTGIAGDTRDARLQLAVPSVLTLVVLSTAFTSLAIGTGFDRRYGVLKHLGTTPLGSGGLLASKSVAVAVVEIGQTVLLLLVAVALGWHPPANPLAWLLAALFMALGTVALGSLGFLLAGTLRAEAVLAVANGIFLLLLGAGGIAIPLDRLPAGVAAVAELLPTGALAAGLTSALTSTPALALGPLAILLAWAVIGAALAIRFFRWD